MDKKKEKLIEKEIVKKALDDSEIKFYLPDAKIIKYSELKNYSSLFELLPKHKSYCVLLIENSPNVGHWVCLMRYNDKKYGDVIEFFDSLADDGKPDSELKWNDKKTNIMLGQNEPLLTNMLLATNLPVIYNKYKFQLEKNKKFGNKINSCGRHVVFRIKNLLDCDRNLEAYLKFMREIKKESKNSYDEIVSHMVGGEIFKNKM
jgi:hypothetical protein